MSLIECMAAGCVPVASRIRGATDAIVRHAENGFLFPIGDTAAASALLARLAQDGALHARMREAGIRTVRERFSARALTDSYLGLFRTVAGHAERPPQLAISEWRLDSGLRPGWWFHLPQGVKNVLRVVRDRAFLYAAPVNFE